MHEADYSLQANSKIFEAPPTSTRAAQFRHIHDTATAFLAVGAPVVSVHCKKKELIGQYENNGK